MIDHVVRPLVWLLKHKLERHFGACSAKGVVQAQHKLQSRSFAGGAQFVGIKCVHQLLFARVVGHQRVEDQAQTLLGALRHKQLTAVIVGFIEDAGVRLEQLIAAVGQIGGQLVEAQVCQRAEIALGQLAKLLKLAKGQLLHANEQLLKGLAHKSISVPGQKTLRSRRGAHPVHMIPRTNGNGRKLNIVHGQLCGFHHADQLLLVVLVLQQREHAQKADRGQQDDD